MAVTQLNTVTQLNKESNMAIGVTTTISASIETYDALHAAMLRHPMPPDVGLISHVTRQTADGFEITEVWDSKASFEQFMQEIVPTVLREVLGDAEPIPEPRSEVWEIRGLVVPSAGVAV
jgi:hypothetical protein